ncbi:MAG: hypothetical protein DLM73_13590 [Chthoniobacterales bacterium]|nr:MAG: hypothetical protein DLM73_13590 [Chthoniobacterales bacterium]
MGTELENMDENLQEDWLDARLRDETAYIDDAGFTAGVVQKLPARRVRSRYRAAFLIAVTLLGSAIAYRISGGGWFIAEEVTRFTYLPIPAMWLIAAAVTILVMAGGLAAVISKSKSGGRLR